MQRHLDRFPQVLRFQLTARRRDTQPRAISHRDVNLAYYKKVCARVDSCTQSTHSVTWSMSLFSTSTPKHINSLPELCLLTIFDSLPLSDLTRIGFVCSQWHSLQGSAFARRNSLKLVVVTTTKPRPHDNCDIRLKCYSSSVTTKVTSLFPNITSLNIQVVGIGLRESGDIALASLITHCWSSKLVKLRLCSTRLNGTAAMAIVEGINRLSTLKSLKLIDAFSGDFKCTFPIVAQLVYFECDMESDIDFLKKYAEGNKSLRQIGVRLPDQEAKTIESYLGLSPQFASKFFGLINGTLEGSLLKSVCAHFTHLLYINVYIRSNLFKRLSSLSLLKQLRNLSLTFDRPMPMQDLSRQLSIAPLDSVVRLSASFRSDSANSLRVVNSINFAHLFPFVANVSLYADYGDEETVQLFQDAQRAETHYQALMEPLKKCKQLSRLDCLGLNYTYKWTSKDTI